MSTMMLVAAVLAGVAIAMMLRGRGTGPSASQLRRALEDGDPGPLLQAAGGLPTTRRSLFFQRAIAALWEEFRRDLALPLIRAFGEGHADEKIAQFWIRQALEVEPFLARKILDEDFLRVHYHPSVARQCGLTGS